MKNTSREPYIYKVTNLETGQYYIGSQCSGKIVGMNYFTSSTNKAFKDGFKTYGEDKYKIAIIKEFENPKKCVKIENYIIRNHMLLKDGLCLNRFYCCNGEKIFSRVGTHHSEETRKKMSITRKGTHRSEGTKQKMSRAHKGTHHSEGTKQKMSRALKGISRSEETRKKISRAHKGIHHSEEAKQKISETHKGLPPWNKGIPSPRRINISIGDNTFDSLTEASKYYNVAIETIRRWAKKNQHNAFYIEK